MLKLIYTQFIYHSGAFCHAELAGAWCFTQRLINITVSKLPSLAEHNCSAAIVARAHISSAEQLPDLSESTLNQGKEAKTPSGKLKLSPSVGLSLAVVGGTEEVEITRSRRNSKTMSFCGTTDRTADRRSKGVISLLFKSKVRLSGLPRQVLYRQVSALNNLKELKA